MDNDLIFEIAVHLLWLVLFVFVLLLAKWVKELISKFDVVKELVINDNPAFNTSYGGYMLSVSIVYIGALLGPTDNWWVDLYTVFGYAVLGVVLLNLSMLINDKFILFRFSNMEEIIEKRNVGVGFVQMSSYLASALIIAGSVYGEDNNLYLTFAIFLAGQLTLVAFAHFYSWLVPFSVLGELKKGNRSAGVALGGGLIASGVILHKGSIFHGHDWVYSFYYFLVCAALIFIVFPVIRFFVNKVIIPESNLGHEIANDQNTGAAFLEMVFYVGFSLIIHSII